MDLSTQTANELSWYLDLATRQLQLTSANMANIDTPGYRSLGMDFEAEMRSAIDGTEAVAGGGTGIHSAPQIRLVDGLIVRPDGNNVSMDRESLQLAEAQLKFKTGVALLKREFTRILDAIHADAR